MADVLTVISLIVITFLVNLGTQVFTYKVIDQKKMRSLKSESSSLRKELFSKKDNPQEMIKVQNKLMDINMQMMKLSLKPTFYTMVPFFILIVLLGQFYGSAGDMIPLPFALPVAGTALGWLGTYFVFSMVFSIVLKPLVTKVGDNLAKKKQADN